MTETKTSWITTKPEEIKEKIIKLAKQGMAADKIGLVLRDQDGIPKTKLLNIKIGKVLKEASLWSNPEKSALERKTDRLIKHHEKHKHDYNAQRSIAKNRSALNKLKLA